MQQLPMQPDLQLGSLVGISRYVYFWLNRSFLPATIAVAIPLTRICVADHNCSVITQNRPAIYLYIYIYI